jgi:hypothetical protein
MGKDRELFDLLAARILARLHEAFPKPVRLASHDLLREEGVEETPRVVCDDTLSWLHTEGYFKAGVHVQIKFKGKRGTVGYLLATEAKASAKDAKAGLTSSWSAS